MGIDTKKIIDLVDALRERGATKISCSEHDWSVEFSEPKQIAGALQPEPKELTPDQQLAEEEKLLFYSSNSVGS